MKEQELFFIIEFEAIYERKEQQEEQQDDEKVFHTEGFIHQKMIQLTDKCNAVLIKNHDHRTFIPFETWLKNLEKEINWKVKGLEELDDRDFFLQFSLGVKCEENFNCESMIDSVFEVSFNKHSTLYLDIIRDVRERTLDNYWKTENEYKVHTIHTTSNDITRQLPVELSEQITNLVV